MMHESQSSQQEGEIQFEPYVPEQPSDCCAIGRSGKLCICDFQIFRVRPYTFEILRAIQPFFEVVTFTNMPHFDLEQIIDHIESVLNQPIADMIQRQEALRNELKNAEKDLSISRDDDIKKLIKKKIQQIKKKRQFKHIEPKVYF